MELITIKTFDNSIDAHLLRIELENEGIECYIYDEHTVTVFPLYSNAVGGIKVKILKKDLELAKGILLSAIKTVICPNCASQYLIVGAKCHAALNGRFSPDIEDVKAVAKPILRHRLVRNYRAEAEGYSMDKIIESLL